MRVGACVVIGLLCLFVLCQLVTLLLLVRRRKQQPIKYRGVWLLLLSGTGMMLSFSWYTLFLAYEIDRAGTDEDAAGASPAHSLRQYFCGDWQWILLICNGSIMGGYFVRSFRILKIFHDHTAWRSPLSLQHQLNVEQVTVDGGGAPVLLSSSTSNVALLSMNLGARKLSSRIYNERKMIVMLLVLLGLLAAVKAIMDAAGLPLQYPGFGCSGPSDYGWLAVDGAEVLLMLLAIWMPRDPRRLRHLY